MEEFINKKCETVINKPVKCSSMDSKRNSVSMEGIQDEKYHQKKFVLFKTIEA